MNSFSSLMLKNFSSHLTWKLSWMLFDNGLHYFNDIISCAPKIFSCAPKNLHLVAQVLPNSNLNFEPCSAFKKWMQILAGENSSEATTEHWTEIQHKQQTLQQREDRFAQGTRSYQ